MATPVAETRRRYTMCIYTYEHLLVLLSYLIAQCTVMNHLPLGIFTYYHKIRTILTMGAFY